MSQRFTIYSGKTLVELLEQLNSHPDYCGRIVFMEHTKEGYRAVLDEWALVTQDIHYIDDGVEEEQELRAYNRELLENAILDTSKTL